MIEILLHGMKMNPLVSLHYYAPVCALINLLVLPFTEGLAPFYEIMRVGCVPPPLSFSAPCTGPHFDDLQAADPSVERGNSVLAEHRSCVPRRCGQRLGADARGCLQGHPAHHGLGAHLWSADHARAGHRVLDRTGWAHLVQDHGQQVSSIFGHGGVGGDYACQPDGGSGLETDECPGNLPGARSRTLQYGTLLRTYDDTLPGTQTLYLWDGVDIISRSSRSSQSMFSWLLLYIRTYIAY